MDIDGIDCNNPNTIGQHVFDSYEQIFNQDDPYKPGDLQAFLGEEGLAQLGQISPEMREMVGSDFSYVDVSLAVNKLKPNKNGGPDTITSDLLKFLFKLAPNLIICVIQCISKALNGEGLDYFAKRFIIFILKLNSTKKNIKKL